MGLSIVRPIHSVEIYLVPMIYKAFETGEILSCALITKGIEYDCKKLHMKIFLLHGKTMALF